MTAKLYAPFEIYPLRCSDCGMKFAVLTLFPPNDGPDVDEDQRSTEWSFMHMVNTVRCPYCGHGPAAQYDPQNAQEGGLVGDSR